MQGPQPTGIFNSWKGDRWIAWAACKGMSRADVQKEYVELITSCDPTFIPQTSSSSRSSKNTAKINTSEAAAAAAATRTALANVDMTLPLPPFEVNQKVFEAAYDNINKLKWSLDASDKLGLYGLYKQVCVRERETEMLCRIKIIRLFLLHA